MSVYGGFTTRNQENYYYELTYKAIFLLAHRTLKSITGGRRPINLFAFLTTSAAGALSFQIS